MATKKHTIHQWGCPKVFDKYLMKDPSDIEMAKDATSSHFTTLPDVHHINERKPGKDTNGHPYKPNSAIEQPTHDPLPDMENSKPPLAEIEDWDEEQPTNVIQDSEIDEGRREQNNKNDECHISNTQVDSNDVETGDDDLKSQKMNNESGLFVGNTYQHKKNLAQGMMDLALLSANANQLRYVMESAASHPYHYPSLTLISLSIVLQNRYHHKLSGATEQSALEPLLEPDKEKPKPLGEIDECDNAQQTDTTLCPGIDDRLLEQVDKTDLYHEGSKSQKMCIHNRNGSVLGTAAPDMNTYQQKNLAQGMMDLALLSANANQLRYVIESASSHPYYYPCLIFISLSIVLQIAVGIGLIINSVKHDKDIHQANKINNINVLGVFIITVVNVFSTSFSVATPTTIVPGTQVAAIQQNG